MGFNNGPDLLNGGFYSTVEDSHDLTKKRRIRNGKVEVDGPERKETQVESSEEVGTGWRSIGTTKRS